MEKTNTLHEQAKQHFLNRSEIEQEWSKEIGQTASVSKNSTASGTLELLMGIKGNISMDLKFADGTSLHFVGRVLGASGGAAVVEGFYQGEQPSAGDKWNFNIGVTSVTAGGLYCDFNPFAGPRGMFYGVAEGLAHTFLNYGWGEWSKA